MKKYDILDCGILLKIHTREFLSFFTIIILISMIIINISYAGSAGTTSAPFLKILPGARPASLGGAFAAVSDSPDACYYNPSGLFQIKNPQLSFMHLVYLEGINYEYLSAGLPLGEGAGTIGIYGIMLGSGDIKRLVENTTGTDYSEDGVFSTMDLLGGLSYGIEISSGFGFGLTVKYIQETLDTKAESGVAVDAGIYNKLSDTFKVGASVSNIGVMLLRGDKYPMVVRAGLSWMIQIEKKDTILAAVDGIYDFETSKIKFGIGLEGYITGELVVRGGYQIGYDAGGITGGFGYKMKLEGITLGLDYGVVPMGDLGLTHRISINSSF